MLLKKLFGLNFKVSIKSWVGQRNCADEVALYIQENHLWLSNSSHSQWSLWVLQIMYSEVSTNPPGFQNTPQHLQEPVFSFSSWNDDSYYCSRISFSTFPTSATFLSTYSGLLGKQGEGIPGAELALMQRRSGQDKSEGVRAKGDTSDGTGILPCPATTATTYLGHLGGVRAEQLPELHSISGLFSNQRQSWQSDVLGKRLIFHS